MNFGDREESSRGVRREIFPSTAGNYQPWRDFREGVKGSLSANFFAGVLPFNSVAASGAHILLFDGRGLFQMVLYVVIPWGAFRVIEREVLAGVFFPSG